jgi:predicted nucleic-acid-binding protein
VAALAACAAGGSDFSNCLDGERARAAGARACCTFDRVLARQPGFSLLR